MGFVVGVNLSSIPGCQRWARHHLHGRPNDRLESRYDRVCLSLFRASIFVFDLPLVSDHVHSHMNKSQKGLQHTVHSTQLARQHSRADPRKTVGRRATTTAAVEATRKRVHDVGGRSRCKFKFNTGASALDAPPLPWEV